MSLTVDQLSIPRPRATSFIELPPEIRNKIYRYIFNHIHCVPIKPNSSRQLRAHVYSDMKSFPYPTSVLRLSKQISNEALDILYGETRFTIEGTDTAEWRFCWFPISFRNQLRIRNVMWITERFYGFENGRPLANLIPWHIIARLRRLTVILPSSVPASLREALFRDFCKHVDEHGRRELLVALDHDREVDLTGLFSRCFTRVGWREVETKDGDLILGRKQARIGTEAFRDDIA